MHILIFVQFLAQVSNTKQLRWKVLICYHMFRTWAFSTETVWNIATCRTAHFQHNFFGISKHIRGTWIKNYRSWWVNTLEGDYEAWWAKDNYGKSVDLVLKWKRSMGMIEQAGFSTTGWCWHTDDYLDTGIRYWVSVLLWIIIRYIQEAEASMICDVPQWHKNCSCGLFVEHVQVDLVKIRQSLNLWAAPRL